MARQIPYKKQKKDNSKRNAMIAFCAVFFGFGLIAGLHKISDFLLGGGIALLVSSLVKVMTTPMKGLDAPSTSDGIMPENVQDDYARSTVVKGLELLEELRKERDAIGEHVFTRRINEFADAYAELLNRVVADHDKASYLRKLNSYYIPTAIKLLQSYRDAKGQGTSYMEISATREDLLKTLEQLVKAVRTLKKQMVKANLETMDIKIEVLEDILRADGFIEDEETAEMRASAEKAAAEIPLTEQMRGTVPAKKAAPAQAAPVQKPAPKAAPAVTLDADMTAPESVPAPTLKANVPTASARQLDQGAPVLYVPGLFPEESKPDEEKSAMF